MSDRKAHVVLGDDELGRLMTDLLDGSISAADHERLAELLRADPQARARYLDAIDLQALLRWDQAAPALRLTQPDVEPVAATAARRWPVWIGAALAAAACLLVAATVALLLPMTTRSGGAPDMPEEPVALVLDSDGGGTLISRDTVLTPGSEVAAGTVALDRGSAEFRLTNGVVVNVRGRTDLIVHDPMHATLERGIATFTCPPDAVGYAVDLPGGARVVDLGTVFEVRAGRDGRAFVTVRSGAVALTDAGGDQAGRLIPGAVALLTDGRWSADHTPGGFDADTYAAFVLTDNPAALWPLDLAHDADATTEAVSGRSVALDGIAAADPATAGPLGRAAVFTGSMSQPLPESVRSTDRFTLEAWAYVAPDASGWQRIVGVNGGADGASWLLGIGPANARDAAAPLTWVVTVPHVRDYRFTPRTPMHGRWHHVALVVEADAPARLYIDGVEAEPTEEAPRDLVLGADLTIGAGSAGHERWGGALAHVAVYSHALPPDALRDHVRLITPAAPESTDPLTPPADAASPDSPGAKR